MGACRSTPGPTPCPTTAAREAREMTQSSGGQQLQRHRVEHRARRGRATSSDSTVTESAPSPSRPRCPRPTARRTGRRWPLLHHHQGQDDRRQPLRLPGAEQHLFEHRLDRADGRHLRDDQLHDRPAATGHDLPVARSPPTRSTAYSYPPARAQGGRPRVDAATGRGRGLERAGHHVHRPRLISPATEFTALINWGDGTSSAGTVTGASGAYAVSGSHTYAEEGTDTRR